MIIYQLIYESQTLAYDVNQTLDTMYVRVGYSKVEKTV